MMGSKMTALICLHVQAHMQFHLFLTVIMDVKVMLIRSCHYHSTGHVRQFVLMAKVVICVMATLLLCVCHTRPDRWQDRSRERGRGLMNAGTVGEQVRDEERYFSPSLSAGR